MKTKQLVITVIYDDSARHPVPTDDELRRSVQTAVDDGLLSNEEGDEMVETWDLEILEPK